MKKLELSLGGITKESLMQLLEKNNIMLNPLGEKLLQSELFQVSKEKREVQLTEISLRELGFEEGANLLDIIKVARSVGLDVCSIDVAPFLRLDYHQNNTYGMEKEFKTPEGAVTVVSEILSEEVTFPKGFYLRKNDGNLWLRGYTCDYDHIFELDEIFIFEGCIEN